MQKFFYKSKVIENHTLILDYSNYVFLVLFLLQALTLVLCYLTLFNIVKPEWFKRAQAFFLLFVGFWGFFVQGCFVIDLLSRTNFGEVFIACGVLFCFGLYCNFSCFVMLQIFIAGFVNLAIMEIKKESLFLSYGVSVWFFYELVAAYSLLGAAYAVTKTHIGPPSTLLLAQLPKPAKFLTVFIPDCPSTQKLHLKLHMFAMWHMYCMSCFIPRSISIDICFTLCFVFHSLIAAYLIKAHGDDTFFISPLVEIAQIIPLLHNQIFTKLDSTSSPFEEKAAKNKLKSLSTWGAFMASICFLFNIFVPLIPENNTKENKDNSHESK